MQASPSPTRQVKWRVFLAGFPRGDPKAAKIMRRCKSPFWIMTFRGEGGVICGLTLLINGWIVFRQIETEDGQWCVAPILFRQIVEVAFSSVGMSVQWLTTDYVHYFTI